MAPLRDQSKHGKALVLLSLFLVSIADLAAVEAAVSAASMTLSFNQIQTERLDIYDRVMQQLAYFHTKSAKPGEIVTLSPPHLSNMTLEVVVLDITSLVANGYMLHEFTLPPGLVINTTASQVVLMYNAVPSETAPFLPDESTFYVPYFAGLEVYPYPPTTTLRELPVELTAPATSPIVVTFPKPRGNQSVAQCTTFSLNGSPAFLNTSFDSTSDQITCLTQYVGEFTLSIGKAVPTTPPTLIATPPTSPVSAPPSPLSAPAPANSSSNGNGGDGATGKSNSTTSDTSGKSGSSGSTAAIWVGVTFGAAMIVAVALLLAWCVRQQHRQKQLEQMDVAAEKAANLETALIGGSRAPAAGALRTKAVLESETF